MYLMQDTWNKGYLCTIASKINVTPNGVYLPISKLHCTIAVANLLAHNNKSQILLLRPKFHHRVLQFLWHI